MKNIRAMGAAGLMVGLVACGGTSSTSRTSSSNFGSTMSPGATIQLDACTQGMSARSVDEHLAIVFDLEQSYHEMVACGGLVGALAGAVIDVIASLVEDPSGGLPDGFTREGGVYTSAPGGDSNTVMNAMFTYGDDYEAGARGDLVEHNVFALKNYLENPSVDFDYTTGDILIRYGARGPLVELLGFGAEPPRPLRINPNNVDRLTREIEKLRIQTTVFVDDQRPNTTVVYELESDPVKVGDMLNGGGFAFDTVSATAWSAAPAQEMATLVWEVDYDDRTRGLDGDIEFSMTGGDFDYHGTFEFNDSTWPVTTVTCLD